MKAPRGNDVIEDEVPQNNATARRRGRGRVSVNLARPAQVYPRRRRCPFRQLLPIGSGEGCGSSQSPHSCGLAALPVLFTSACYSGVITNSAYARICVSKLRHDFWISQLFTHQIGIINCSPGSAETVRRLVLLGRAAGHYLMWL